MATHKRNTEGPLGAHMFSNLSRAARAEWRRFGFNPRHTKLRQGAKRSKPRPLRPLGVHAFLDLGPNERRQLRKLGFNPMHTKLPVAFERWAHANAQRTHEERVASGHKAAATRRLTHGGSGRPKREAGEYLPTIRPRRHLR